MDMRALLPLLGGVTNALIGTLLLALVTRFLVDRLHPEHSSRTCGLMVAVGFAIGRYGIGVDEHDARQLGGAIGAAVAVAALWSTWKRTPPACEAGS